MSSTIPGAHEVRPDYLARSVTAAITRFVSLYDALWEARIRKLLKLYSEQDLVNFRNNKFILHMRQTVDCRRAQCYVCRKKTELYECIVCMGMRCCSDCEREFHDGQPIMDMSDDDGYE